MAKKRKTTRKTKVRKARKPQPIKSLQLTLAEAAAFVAPRRSDVVQRRQEVLQGLRRGPSPYPAAPTEDQLLRCTMETLREDIIKLIDGLTMLLGSPKLRSRKEEA